MWNVQRTKNKEQRTKNKEYIIQRKKEDTIQKERTKVDKRTRVEEWKSGRVEECQVPCAKCQAQHTRSTKHTVPNTEHKTRSTKHKAQTIQLCACFVLARVAWYTLSCCHGGRMQRAWRDNSALSPTHPSAEPCAACGEADAEIALRCSRGNSTHSSRP